MKFVDINGALAKVRRFLSHGQSVRDEDVKDEKKLAEILRSILARLSELEASVPPEAIEFEIATNGAAGLHSLKHGFGGPVRWWVTMWTRGVSGASYPTFAPILVQDATTDANTLVLRSSAIARAIVRIEPGVGSFEQ